MHHFNAPRRIVAWHDRSEWESVYQELYSSELILQKHALDRLAVWKYRMGHKLSTAIVCTWQLASAQFADRLAQYNGQSQHQDQPIRMACAMAIIRFVNLLTEKGQVQRYAQPVHVLADELGLPEWLVEVRHDATHAGLPSMAVLRDGVQFALSWLKHSYWEAQRHGSPEESTQPGDLPCTETAIANHLERIIQEQAQCLSLNTNSNKIVRPLLNDLEKAIKTHRELVVDVLLQEGQMVPSVSQMESLGIPHEALLLDLLFLPHKLVSLWRPVLQLCHHMRLTPRLVETAASRLSEEGAMQDRLLAGWIATIVAANRTAIDGSAGDSEPVVRELAEVYRSPCTLNEQLLLTECLKHPNKYTSTLLPHLFITESLPLDGKCDQLLNLCRMHCDSPAQDDVQQDIEAKPPIHTLQDIASAVDWTMYPLGSCPGQKLSYRSLELPPSVLSLGADAGNCDVTSAVEDSHVAGPVGVVSSDNGLEPITGSIPLKWSQQHLDEIMQDIKVY